LSPRESFFLKSLKTNISLLLKNTCFQNFFGENSIEHTFTAMGNLIELSLNGGKNRDQKTAVAGKKI
jgi:hypothetical protein